MGKLTYKEIKEVFYDIEIGGGLKKWGVHTTLTLKRPACLSPDGSDAVTIRAFVPVVCVQTGKPTDITTTTTLPLSHSKEHVVMAVYSTIQDLLMHELNESLTYKGEHITNPHPEQS